MELEFKAREQGELEEASVETVDRLACLPESDDGGSQLGFAFSFFVGRIDTVAKPR